MCAILDANVASEVFGRADSAAGDAFADWVWSGSGRLVVGGHLRTELLRTGVQRVWQELIAAGRLEQIEEREVAERTEEIRKRCRSDDAHVVALAQVSGARLLYSNDRRLQDDFGDAALIDDPRGAIFSTIESKEFTRDKQALLERRELCRRPE